MKRASATLLVLGLILTGGVADPAGNQGHQPTLSVMTRNQYFGADLAPVAGAPDVPSFLAAARTALIEIAANDFPARAGALAREIADRRPHVVALQEVEDFRIDGQHTGAPFVDQLELTLAALTQLGAPYVAVAQVRNLALTVPADLDGNGVPDAMVSITDHDVILARRDLVDAGLVVPVPLSSICARPSADSGPGCNYSVRLIVNTPLGALSLERGFVAVDVLLSGRRFRVVNTHLEVENLDPSDPLSPLIQSAQAAELKGLIEAVSAGATLIVAGDFNSTPEDPLFPDPFAGPFARPYRQFVEGVDLQNVPSGDEFRDTWQLRPGDPAGFPNLRSHEFSVTERKDLIFTRELPADLQANVFGNNRTDRTRSGLWPSDHAGVWVRFVF